MTTSAVAKTAPLAPPIADVTASPWRKLVSLPALAPIGVGVVLALLPPPPGLHPGAWHYFALFAAVVVALMLEPLPAAALGLLGVSLAAILGLAMKPAELGKAGIKVPAEMIKWALAGFSNSIIWLIFAAFMFALGYEKTGLGKRIALVLVKRLGGRTLGLGYAVAISDLILAPVTPSVTARSAGTIFPVIRNIPALYGSEPGPTSRRLGGYLMWTALASTCVTSSMFITALAPNLLALEIVKKVTSIDITWTQWTLAFLPAGVVLLILIPLLTYVVYPPEVKRSPEVTRWAAEQLAATGKMTRRELTMAVLVLGALSFWVFGREVVDATTVAVTVVGLMVVAGVVTWDDICSNKAAWNILVWFATLVTLAEGLSRVGFITWLTGGAAKAFAGMSPTAVMLALLTVYYFMHYLFASLSAHTTAVLPVMLAAGAAVPGLSMTRFAMLLCFSQGLFGVLTPYGAGHTPIYYGSGYIGRKDYWRLGLIFGVVFFAALVLIEAPFLR